MEGISIPDDSYLDFADTGTRDEDGDGWDERVGTDGPTLTSRATSINVDTFVTVRPN